MTLWVFVLFIKFAVKTLSFRAIDMFVFLN